MKAVRTVGVRATPAEVWWLLATSRTGRTGTPTSVNVSAPDGVRPNATLTWRSGPGRITSIFAAVEPERELSWTGRSLGIQAVHVYPLEPTTDGTTVVVEES